MNTKYATEPQRVQSHIARAEQLAAARTIAHLTPLQQLVRSLLLEALSEYREAGIFPQNPQLGTQLPFFIDAHGTRCAMAHLLELGGEHELVARIANERNNAWVHELADEPRLLAWLNAAGLTVEEAAAIQPSYCGPEYQCVCNPIENNQSLAPVRDIFVARITQDAGVQRTAQAEVVQTFGIDGGVAEGQSVTLYADYGLQSLPVGAMVLGIMPVSGLRGLPGAAAGLPLDQNGQWVCRGLNRGYGPIEPALAAQALTSNNCPGTLTAADPRWANDPCVRSDAATPQRDATATADASVPPVAIAMRCSVLTPGSADPTSLGILLSIASALLARRRQHRARIRSLDNTQNAQK